MERFTHFGYSHFLALATIIALAYAALRFMQSEADEMYKIVFRKTLASLLIFSVLLDFPLSFIRWGMNDLGWEMFRMSSLPLHLCDIVSIVAAIALFTKNRHLTEVTYLWGITGTTQGLITPTLAYGWGSLDFYNFFLQHGAVPIAAIVLVYGMHIYPAKGAFKRIVLWSWAYMIIVIPINYLIDENYGFLNAKPTFDTIFDYMGPHPYYLITLQIIAFSLYLILLALGPKHKKEPV